MKEIIIANDKDHLKLLIDKEMLRNGLQCDLNHIDVSKITDMSNLFELSKFDGDISQWNVSKVKNMYALFNGSEFNGDISNWNVSSVRNMAFLFNYSKFNKNISKWSVSKVKNMMALFSGSLFNGDISNWNISNVKNMNSMFEDSNFNKEISNWEPLALEFNNGTFLNSKLLELPYWANYTREELKNGAIKKYLDKIDFKEKLLNELEDKTLYPKRMKI